MEIYPPAEDSWLLEEVILTEKLKGKNCLDMGAGSGIQSRAMIKAGAKKIVAVDINTKSLEKLKTQFVGQNFKVLKSDLFNNIKEKYDFIAFNPPYVPSEDIRWKDTDGGERGREIIDIFLGEFDKYLTKNGILLLLVSSLNNEKQIIKIIKKKGFGVKIVGRKKLFFEELFVIKAIKNTI